jgi:hypothetical protein
MLPSWIRSSSVRPRPVCRFAIDTTSRRLASINEFLADMSFISIRFDSRTSSSRVSRGTLPMLRRYSRTASSAPSSGGGTGSPELTTPPSSNTS